MSLHIEGRRWFQRGPGNTYHSVRIFNLEPISRRLAEWVLANVTDAEAVKLAKELCE